MFRVRIYSMFLNFDNLSDDEKLLLLMTEKLVKLIASFIWECLEIRRHTMYINFVVTTMRYVIIVNCKPLWAWCNCGQDAPPPMYTFHEIKKVYIHTQYCQPSVTKISKISVFLT